MKWDYSPIFTVCATPSSRNQSGEYRFMVSSYRDAEEAYKQFMTERNLTPHQILSISRDGGVWLLKEETGL